ncbi:MAG: hypothetical protein ABEJ82_07710 [Haloplanus sp.]
MGAIPGDLETDAQPPMTVPLRHFVVGLGFLVAGGVVGALAPFGLLPGRPTLAHVHLLLVGWVCLTIMGAMTQFVPVWSGVRLHSARLATLQLWLVVVGLLGFVGALSASATAWLPVFGSCMLAGFWTFAYNVGRTLRAARPWDVTERHFALAVAFLVVVTAFGVTLAASLAHPGLLDGPVTRLSLRDAHATLAVFGVVLTTVVGALSQLVPMFTQSEYHGVDAPLRRVEAVGYPVGVVALATGRLFGLPAVGRVGAVLVATGLFAFGVVLARRLLEARVAWTPMLSRYAVAALSLLAWAVLAVPAWFADPLSPTVLFGPPELGHLLLFGVVGFTVLGTLYHVVPFIVWVHRYSDDLGLRAVPAIDDLYDDRLAAADFALTGAGCAALVAAESLGRPRSLFAVGGLLAVCGFLVFAANMLLVLRDHGPQSVATLFVPAFADDATGDDGAAPGGRGE